MKLYQGQAPDVREACDLHSGVPETDLAVEWVIAFSLPPSAESD